MSENQNTAEPASKVDLPDHLGGGGGEIPSFDCTFQIARFDPEKDEAPHLSLIHI